MTKAPTKKRMAKRTLPLSIERAAMALRKHAGIMTYAAEELGCARQTLWLFIQKHPELADVRAEAGEILLDTGEKHLTTAINGGDLKTIRWHLERKGKDRGYTTRQEQTGKDGEPLEVGVIERRIVDPAPQEEPQDDESDNGE